MKFGVNTLLWTAAFDRDHLGLLDGLREHGFDGIEIARFDFSGFPAAEIRRALESTGLQCTFCSALTGKLSLVSEDANVRREAREFLKQGVQSAAELGSSMFVGPFCSPVGYLPGRRRTSDEWKYAVDGLREVARVAEEYRVTVAVEPLNRFETYFLNTVEDGVRLCDEVAHPRVGLLVDTFHSNIEEKDVGASFARAGRHLKHVHACENDRGIPGSGHIEWAGVASALAALNYNGWAVIESFGFSIKEIAAAACIWRDLAPSVEAIAFDGLVFLKGGALGAG